MVYKSFNLSSAKLFFISLILNATLTYFTNSKPHNCVCAEFDADMLYEEIHV